MAAAESSVRFRYPLRSVTTNWIPDAPDPSAPGADAPRREVRHGTLRPPAKGRGDLSLLARTRVAALRAGKHGDDVTDSARGDRNDRRRTRRAIASEHRCPRPNVAG